MLSKRMYILFGIFIFLVGCAAPNVSIIDKSGRQIPTPNYVLFSTGDHPLQITFYWAALKSRTDIDGSTYKIPFYFDYNKQTHFNKSEYDNLTLTIEIYNPTEKEYSLWESCSIVERSGDKGYGDQNIAKSNLRYRTVVVNLPYEDSYRKISYGVKILDNNGSPIMYLGDLKYLINRKEVIQEQHD